MNMVRLHRSRGSALLETALVLPVFLALVLGITEFSRVLRYSQAVTQSARAGAEYGVLRQDGGRDLRRVEEAAVLSAGIPGMTAHANTFTDDGHTYLRVITEYRFQSAWRYPGLPDPLPLKGAAVMRIH